MADHSSHVHHCDQPHPSHVRSSQPPPSPEQFPNVLGAREPRTRYEPPSYNPIPATRHMGTSHSSTGNNRSYHGIRCRSGKWVSEIREPRKSNRIWLGTYPTAEMAAVAHDVAALALRGTDAILNFPETVRSYPVPASTSPSDIRAAAAAAASVLMKPRIDDAVVPENDGVASFASSGKVEEFIDEEEIFDMPTLLVSMAEGMLMSPPWLSPPSSDDSPEVSESSGSLWSYP